MYIKCMKHIKYMLRCQYIVMVVLLAYRTTGEEKMTKRININLDDKTFEELQALANRKRKTMSETLRDALALEQWFQDTQDAGNNVLVEITDSGTARQVIRPR